MLTPCPTAAKMAAVLTPSDCPKPLQENIGERNATADSDQGRSFRASWDFLMLGRRQGELTELLDRVLSLPPAAELAAYQAQATNTAQGTGDADG